MCIWAGRALALLGPNQSPASHAVPLVLPMQVRRSVGLQLIRSSGSGTQGQLSSTVPSAASSSYSPSGAELHHFVAAESDAQAAMHFRSAAELAVALREHLGATSAAAAAAASPAAGSSARVPRRKSVVELPQLDGSLGSALAAEAPMAAAATAPIAVPAAAPPQLPDASEGVSGTSPAGSSAPGSANLAREAAAALMLAPAASLPADEADPALAAAAPVEMAASMSGVVAAEDREQPPTPPAAAASRRLVRVEQGLRGRQLLRLIQQQQALLLRWVEEQEAGGVQTFEKAKAALIVLKVGSSSFASSVQGNKLAAAQGK